MSDMKLENKTAYQKTKKQNCLPENEKIRDTKSKEYTNLYSCMVPVIAK
jgi:hypothetical protein